MIEKVAKLYNDVGVLVEVRDTEACCKLFQKESNNHLPKRTIVRFVNWRFAEDLQSKQNISSMLDFNKLGFLNTNLCVYYKKLWGMCKELKNSGHIKYLWETSGNIRIWLDSGIAVIKVLHQRNLEIGFPNFNFL